ncbi:MAG: hypothetical protein PWP16_1909 [Eubacteriaceae bacterium]|jgi:hypothetical protein|nr:hypothetical protein [Eubacteriaceae bacterium]MDK2904871.1 hypothetical protein [Eubacteriaceae bacterium]MDK2937356.1 hypothetical protein [Eubacteriaceae bacterium]MDK2961995.1 hypothetical protein [Eubacteriaceae bacterium]MDN5308546.1 hypothetical protein [Eubacteriaceae bacterium]
MLLLLEKEKELDGFPEEAKAGFMELIKLDQVFKEI